MADMVVDPLVKTDDVGGILEFGSPIRHVKSRHLGFTNHIGTDNGCPFLFEALYNALP
jgi:hypothetical protein